MDIGYEVWVVTHIAATQVSGPKPNDMATLNFKGSKKAPSSCVPAQNNEWTTLMTPVGRLLEQLMRAVGGGGGVVSGTVWHIFFKSKGLAEIGFYNKLLCHPKFLWPLVSPSVKWSPGPLLDKYFYFTFFSFYLVFHGAYIRSLRSFHLFLSYYVRVVGISFSDPTSGGGGEFGVEGPQCGRDE